VDAASTVQQRAITVSRAIDDKCMVSYGTSAEDRLIVEGMQKVRPGTNVKAVPFDENKSIPLVAAGPDGQSQKQAEGGK